MSSRARTSPPYGSYAAIVGAFGGLLVGTAALDRARRGDRPVSALDITLLAAASFKVARVISRERVGSIVREPFVEGERPTGEGRTSRNRGARDMYALCWDLGCSRSPRD